MYEKNLSFILVNDEYILFFILHVKSYFQRDINSLVSDQWPENRLHVTTLREIDRTVSSK